MMFVNENCQSNCWEPMENGSSVGLVVANRLNAIETCASFEPWTNPSYGVPPNPNSTEYCGDQGPFLPDESNLSKQGCSPMKDLGICDGDNLCEGFNMNDMWLIFEKSDDILGCSQSHSRYHFKDVGVDCPFMQKNLHGTESSGPNENAIEVLSESQISNFSYLIISSSNF